MAGVKSHWNQSIADDPLGSAKSEGPGRVSTTSSAGDAAGPMVSTGADKVNATKPMTLETFAGSSGLGGRVVKKYLEKNGTKDTNAIQGVNRKR